MKSKGLYSADCVIIIHTMIDKLFLEKNGYTFKSNLGAGMYGKVVCAYSTQRQRKVAIKIVDTKKFNSDNWEVFLSREMEIIRSLNHPNIVKTYQILEMKKNRTVSTTDWYCMINHRYCNYCMSTQRYMKNINTCKSQFHLKCTRWL